MPGQLLLNKNTIRPLAHTSYFFLLYSWLIKECHRSGKQNGPQKNIGSILISVLLCLRSVRHWFIIRCRAATIINVLLNLESHALMIKLNPRPPAVAVEIVWLAPLTITKPAIPQIAQSTIVRITFFTGYRHICILALTYYCDLHSPAYSISDK